MREETTPAVQRAREAAENWARRLGHSSAGTTALLLGLLEEEEGQAAQLLIKFGGELQAVRERLASLDLKDEPSAARSVREAAGQLARELSGERTIRSEHFLLALLKVSKALRDTLLALGVAVDEIESAVQSDSVGPLSLDEPLEFTATPPQMDLGRILDASANRAREAIRVVEDYCRFALNDAILSRELKTLRHDLNEALSTIGDRFLLTTRDTPGDVGTAITTEAESRRDSLEQVVHVNLKRLQEALRSLEEYGKVASSRTGAAIEKLRYRSYTLEQSILQRMGAATRLANARLYLLLTGSACAASIEFVIFEAVAGGVDIVQLREKSLSDRELLDRARRVRRWTSEAGALFIINDRPDIAAIVDADGVHLGQDDMAVRDARRIVGPDALIGVSTHSLEQLRQAALDGASYVGVGPVFASRTKQFDELPGLEYVRQANRESTIPMFALGGITSDNISQVVAEGASRVAVSAAICGADEPQPIAATLKRLLLS
jgi:thiamine-phosphate pyrophosphorylase